MMDTVPSATTPRIIFSAAEDSFHAAQQELRAAFGKDAQIERWGRDTGCFVAPGITIAQVAAACRQRPVIFIQHLMQATDALPTRDALSTMQPIADRALALVRTWGNATSFALHLWASDGAMPCQYRPDELRKWVATRLTEQGYTVTRGNQANILSICLTPHWVALGINRTADAITDWPGGRIGLAKGAGQISRAEFKLEELLQVCPLELPPNGLALDLGASPGGWTHILRQHGQAVWAVDPAQLDPRIVADRGVQHMQTTAGAFLAATTRRFDVVVNDMRMTPELSCQAMLHAAQRLKPGGLAIVTLKLFKHNALATVENAVAILKRAYAIVFVRQLFHNRHEVTVVARRQAHIAPRPLR
jgi:23S rRNA (cytidine2498-2'-O)-methyltransferase